MSGGQMGKIGGNFRLLYPAGTSMMKKDILENSANIAFFGFIAIVSCADNIAHLIE